MNQHLPTTKRHVLKPAEMREILHELIPITEPDEVPLEVIAWSRKRVWTRMRATYASGWEVTVNFDRKGEVSSTSAKIRGHYTTGPLSPHKPAEGGRA